MGMAKTWSFLGGGASLAAGTSQDLQWTKNWWQGLVFAPGSMKDGAATQSCFHNNLENPKKKPRTL
jgi:hypothetical protein